MTVGQKKLFTTTAEKENRNELHLLAFPFCVFQALYHLASTCLSEILYHFQPKSDSLVTLISDSPTGLVTQGSPLRDAGAARAMLAQWRRGLQGPGAGVERQAATRWHFLLAPIPESSSDYLLPKDIKLAVLGAGRVGKSAMIVRFLTKRFIGDYEPNTGKLYSRLVYVEGDQVSLQIQDTPGGIQVQDSLMQAGDPLSKCVQWAEGFLLVYSITDYDSYLAIRPLHQHIRKVHPDSRAPIVIVGNKGDLLHARQVQTREGVQLANELGSLFLEVSTSENYEDVCDAFRHLCREVSKLHNLGSERRRASVVPRPRSPNMQDLKRRFKQALSSKAKAPSAPALG
ncbi:PREDICTED: ras-like protein family member 11A [Bison bison bison]|uniref:small monomeric GTPase n=2 Tax=Bovinae TaxID=27592 RepID=A0A6P3I535_BISBB|nr:PREDICTED: ras-like protein family member 11A [Bison bison bison]